MSVYYNEWEPYPAQWLRNLIKAGHLPDGEVDERDIRDVQPDDLRGFDQCHFFAGIGGWPLALKWAGWEGPVWTGSCPCQPLSSAGQRKGHADERHLWPAFYELIAECKPPTVFGEQVASKDGREWLSGVRADLEGLGYAIGAADLCAASVGAPHIRQRVWWVADSEFAERRPQHQTRTDEGRNGISQWKEGANRIGSSRTDGGVALSEGQQSHGGRPKGGGGRKPSDGCGMGWAGFDLVPCADGKARRVEPGTFPLAHGIPNRVGRLRAYGNAIVPQVGAEFIRAYMES